MISFTLSPTLTGWHSSWPLSPVTVGSVPPDMKNPVCEHPPRSDATDSPTTIELRA